MAIKLFDFLLLVFFNYDSINNQLQQHIDACKVLIYSLIIKYIKPMQRMSLIIILYKDNESMNERINET